MPLVIVGIGIVVLLVLVSYFRLNAFIALLITSFLTGLLSGMPLVSTLDAVLKGTGDTLGKVVIILAFGAILGKQLEESGAAHAITYRLTELIGEKRVRYAMLITGILIGLPMMYNAGFLVLIPLVYAMASTTRQPMIWLALPLISALSVTHCFLPPHPAPTAAAFIYGADVNTTLLIGLVLIIPCCLVGGVLLSHLFRKIDVKPPPDLFTERNFLKDQLPGMGISILTALLPVILMLLGSLSDIIVGPPPAMSELQRQGIDGYVSYYRQALDPAASDIFSFIIPNLLSLIRFISDANIALMIAALFGLWSLGLRRGLQMNELMKSAGTAISSVAMIMLIIGGGGAFSQVLKESLVTDYISQVASGIEMNPLLLAFSMAAVLRLAIGSATVSALATAPLMLPLAQQTGTSPELMVLATGTGSVMWSHFNDSGFWMFKEYFNLSVKQTLLTWTVMECVLGITGIIIVLLLNIFI